MVGSDLETLVRVQQCPCYLRNLHLPSSAPLAAQEPLQPAAYDQPAAVAFIPTTTPTIHSICNSFLGHSKLSVATSIHCHYLPRGLRDSFSIRAGLDQQRSQTIATLFSHHAVALLGPSETAPLAANNQQLSARKSYVRV